MNKKIINIIQICAYIFTYILVFNAYDASRVNNVDGSNYQLLTVYVMVMVGLAFTMSMLRYRLVIKNRLDVRELVIIYDILQLAFMIMSVIKAIEMWEEAAFINDTISLLHSSLAMIMSYTILAVVIISLSIDIGLCIGKKNNDKSIQDEQPISKTYASSRIHVPVIVTLVATVVMCSLYSYSILSLVFFMWFFLIAFPLPMGLFLSSVVREWIEKKKYMLAIGAYVAYTYMVYGVLHNLFYKTIYGYSTGSSAMTLVFDGFVGWINVVAGGIVVVTLIIKATKNRKEN